MKRTIPAGTGSARHAHTLLLAALSILAGTTGAWADWPQWRHDANRSGATDERCSDQMVLQWQRDLGQPDPAYDHQYRMCADASYAAVAGARRPSGLGRRCLFRQRALAGRRRVCDRRGLPYGRSALAERLPFLRAGSTPCRAAIGLPRNQTRCRPCHPLWPWHCPESTVREVNRNTNLPRPPTVPCSRP